MVAELDRQAKEFAEESARQFGYDCQDNSGAGAAGGLGYAFMQYMGAECRSGIELLLDTIFDDNENQNENDNQNENYNNNNNAFAGASLVITGEGSADSQTLMGKLPMGILQRARLHDIPVVLIAGRIKNRRQLLDAGFARVECINPPDLSAEEAMKPERAKENISATTAEIISGYSGLAPH
jgi:glycerate kinase